MPLISWPLVNYSCELYREAANVSTSLDGAGRDGCFQKLSQRWWNLFESQTAEGRGQLLTHSLSDQQEQSPGVRRLIAEIADVDGPRREKLCECYTQLARDLPERTLPYDGLRHSGMLLSEIYDNAPAAVRADLCAAAIEGVKEKSPLRAIAWGLRQLKEVQYQTDTRTRITKLLGKMIVAAAPDLTLAMGVWRELECAKQQGVMNVGGLMEILYEARKGRAFLSATQPGVEN